MMKAAPGWSPAWQPGTAVAEVTIKPGTTVQMVVSERQFASIEAGKYEEAFGGWATFHTVPDLSYARKSICADRRYEIRTVRSGSRNHEAN